MTELKVCSFCRRTARTPGVSKLIEAVNAPGKCICNICVTRAAKLASLAPSFVKVVNFTHEGTEPLRLA